MASADPMDEVATESGEEVVTLLKEVARITYELRTDDKAAATTELYEAFCEDSETEMPLGSAEMRDQPMRFFGHMGVDATSSAEDDWRSTSVRCARIRIMNFFHYGIDRAFDMMLRFGQRSDGSFEDRSFFVFWLKWAADCAQLYTVWKDDGSYYNQVNEGENLWIGVELTDTMESRLAYAYLHEGAEMLDFFAQLRTKLERLSDNQRFLKPLAETRETFVTMMSSVVEQFKSIVPTDTIETYQAHVKSVGADPRLLRDGVRADQVDDDTRTAIGMSPEWYEALLCDNPVPIVSEDGAARIAKGALSKDRTSTDAFLYVLYRMKFNGGSVFPPLTPEEQEAKVDRYVEDRATFVESTEFPSYILDRVSSQKPFDPTRGRLLNALLTRTFR